MQGYEAANIDTGNSCLAWLTCNTWPSLRYVLLLLLAPGVSEFTSATAVGEVYSGNVISQYHNTKLWILHSSQAPKDKPVVPTELNWIFLHILLHETLNEEYIAMGLQNFPE